jgi:glycosyltransferase involved in cell wall biosynthesis
MIARRIGIDVTSALTQGGGIGRYTRELIRALVSINSADELHLFSARIPDSKPLSESLPSAVNVAYHPAPLSERWLYRLWYRVRLPVPIQWVTGPLDLFHSPDFVLPPTSGNIPTLLTVHDLSFLHYPETFPNALVDYLNRIVPWSVNRATHILADSKSTKEDLLSSWQIPAEKVTVLYSGVNEQFRPLEDSSKIAAVRQKYGLDERPYVFAVGTVQPRKNYQMLIRAFRPLAMRLPHNLAFAGGKGWLDEGMKSEVERQGLKERVRFTGFVADEDLPALYCGASLLAFPSLYEGFGLPILEAMACGLPCIISDASSLPEVGGDAAIQLPPTNEIMWTEAMLELLTDEEKQAQMIETGFIQARSFSWNKAAKELVQVYNSLLEMS